MRLRFTSAIVVTLAVGWASASAAPVPKAVKAKPKSTEPTLEQKLIGTWRLDGEDVYVEYMPGGVLEMRFESAGGGCLTLRSPRAYKVLEPDAEYPLGRLDADYGFRGIVKLAPGLELIEKVTGDEMVKRNSAGVVQRYERVKDK